jgi:hypothetical protein
MTHKIQEGLKDCTKKTGKNHFIEEQVHCEQRLCVVPIVPLTRSKRSFDSFETFLIGYRDRPGKVQEPL